jgi:hypothetical protein
MKDETTKTGPAPGDPSILIEPKMIEFIDGPFDGHWQSYRSEFRKLPNQVILLTAQDPEPTPTTSRSKRFSRKNVLLGVALYAIKHLEHPPIYRYLGSISGASFQRLICGMTTEKPMAG